MQQKTTLQLEKRKHPTAQKALQLALLPCKQ